jgi:uncharacterized protein YkwD
MNSSKYLSLLSLGLGCGRHEPNPSSEPPLAQSNPENPATTKPNDMAIPKKSETNVTTVSESDSNEGQALSVERPTFCEELGKSSQESEIASLFSQINILRGKQEAPPLTADERLSQSALNHGQDMVTRSYFSHVSPDGGTVSQRVAEVGFAFMVLAENLALGQTTGVQVLSQWKVSPGHLSNLLSLKVTRIGLARCWDSSDPKGDSTSRWVAVFATPKKI